MAWMSLIGRSDGKQIERLADSVNVTYLDGEAILEQLRQASRRIRQNPNVVNVYLFGSFTRGDYVPGSDADIAIILKRDDRRIMDRIPEFLAFFDEVDVGVDVFPYTEAEFEHMKSADNPFIQEILSNGVEL